MSTTVNKVDLGPVLAQRGNRGVYTNEYRIDRYPATYSRFQMRKIGAKDYAFFAPNASAYVARYKCSHLEAERRFIALLTTRRLMS